MGIFSGTIVLDLTKVLSGPLATRYLSDYGATVIKIEHPNAPDDTRMFPPLKNGWSGYFEMLNRNKQSITLDLTNPRHKKIFYSLCKKADVIVENLTTSTKYKLGIDYQTVKKYNRKIIYASLAGVDQNSDRKYYDIIAQAESGLLSLTGTPKRPIKIGPAVVDAFAGMNLAFAIASALYFRAIHKKGQFIEVSMLACAMNLLEQNLIEYSITKKNPKRTANMDNAIAPFGVFQTKDGQIAVAVGSDSLWQKFCAFLESKQKVDHDLFSTNALRLKHTKKLQQLMEKVFVKFTTGKLLTLLHQHNIPCAPVNQMSDIYNSSWFYQSNALQKIDHPKLGTCVVPGKAIDFDQKNSDQYIPSPAPGQDNKKYGI